MKLTRLVICIALALITAVASAQTDTTFIYQGELNENGTPANGDYAMDFILFDSAGGGLVVGVVVHGAVPVVDGKFTAELDFGGAAFDDNRWLKIEINGVPLTPRTPITHAPYSIQTRGIFVDDGGYVGIGTNNPQAGLHLVSPEGYGSAVALNNTGGGLEWRLVSWPNGKFYLVKSTGTTLQPPLVVEPVNGHVGIGTSLPNQKLSVHNNDAGSSYIRVSDFTSGPTSGLRVGMSGSGNAYIINDQPQSLSLGTSGTTQLRINDIGQVGINELSPEMMLHVKQDIANAAIRTEHQTTADYWDTGIGATTKNYKFIYNNVARSDISSVDGAYTQFSDRQLKQDMQEMPAVLDKVGLLKPASYLYLDNTDGGPRSIGFIAQDVEPLFPDLVRETDEGTKGLVYDGFAVISIKAIQELDTKVNQLETDNDELRTRLGSLEQLVEQLALTQQEITK